MGDLPTLRVLGWDDEDTVLHLDHADKILRQKLRWPEDSKSLEDWRLQWSSAFTLRPREVIGTSKALAERMAELATAIRKRVNRVLSVESEAGVLRKLMAGFREALIHDLTEDDFADTYAQTITYGLLTARVSRPAGLVAENVRDRVPITNPFLRDMLSTFLTVGGRKGRIDFDELGINEVVQALRDADMEAVMRDFGDKNPQEDPVIHFYQLFLKEYDPVKRIKRGVFFTPRPVVSFIVRTVDEILRKEFALEDGLADTTTWGEMAKRHQDLKIPKGVKPGESFVQVLDPACGTGTFLVEVIDVIHRTMKAKWRKQRHMELEIPKLWNDYVAEHLLPRLYGFELMMAPYAIAHMKIGLKLWETGYTFQSHERARIYLTNTLEEPKDFSDRFEFDAPALAHEGHAVNAVKRGARFTVVIGNPPYAGHSANASWEMKDGRNVPTFIGRLVQDYYRVDGRPLGERNPKWLQDDYVKFLRFGQWSLQQSGLGILSMISNHGYLDNPTFRGMRQWFVEQFQRIFVLDLHGNTKKKEKCPDGSKDENVFDIQQGVAIGAFVKSVAHGRGCNASHTDLWGIRDAPGRSPSKYNWLAAHSVVTARWTTICPHSPFYLFIPEDSGLRSEYDEFWKITDVMPVNVLGFQTHRDDFAIAFDEATMRKRVEDLLDAEISDKEIRDRYGLTDGGGWGLHKVRKRLRADSYWQRHLIPCLYRPFDWRYCYFSPTIMDRPRGELLQHVAGKDNLCLNTVRQTRMANWAHAVVSNCPTPAVFVELKDGSNVFPLYLYETAEQGTQRVLPNGAPAKRRLNLALPRREGPLAESDPEGVLAYTYAIFYSPSFQWRYAQFLKSDFPRVPLTGNASLFRRLWSLGADLIALHLVDDDYASASWNLSKPKGECPLKKLITKFAGRGDAEVARGYPKFVTLSSEATALSDSTVPGGRAGRKAGAAPLQSTARAAAPALQGAGAHAGARPGRVYINPTRYFEGVPEDVWSFYVGGYQVCEKWLKDRRGRTLSDEDILHYRRVVVALNETIRLMAEIDRVIDAHGGWPDAFVTK